jgi:DsbC/DsbD-like thiol-disulfide interchange protein
MRRASASLAPLSRYGCLISLALFFLIGTGPATDGAQVSHGTLDLLSESSWIVPGQDFTLGFHFKLEKGWHIYWVTPGDSGEPPRVTWQLPQGISAGDMEWPVPHKLGTKAGVDFGYDGEVLLPVKLHAANSLSSAQPSKLDAGVRFLICREVCIPGKAQLSLTLPVKSQTPAAADAALRGLFATTRARLPRRTPTDWKVTVNEDKVSIVLNIQTGSPDLSAINPADVFFFPLAESQIENAAPQKYSHTVRGIRLTLRKSDQLARPIQRLKGVLVLSDKAAYVVDAPIEHAGGSAQKRNSEAISKQSTQKGDQK